MPRVTQSHRDRQTARILAAAQLCFARRGFDGASMDEIIAEAGMSSSTVYRYFPEGKRSLVRAVIGRVMDPVVDWIAGLAEVDELPSFEDVFVTAVERSWVFGRPFLGEADASPEAESSESSESAAATAAPDQIDLMVGVWAELARQPDLREVYADGYIRVRGEIARVVRQWQGRGVIAGGIDPDEAAAVIHNAAVGLIIQRTVTGELGRADAATTAHAVTRLLGL
ncbi:TetR/AcrR family transcriptional regulator [Actinomyces massiliensis]|jgi:transcriptional regulator, TetR family|nr:TetR/AcrR family transcriptional regulator [Actinomyces massiliensis]WLD72285.1 TetR/AcrR family transcriptional regulator [Actinomyces massiliensis]